MATPDQAPRKARRWTRIVLVLSLGANLAVVGLIAGAFLSGKGPIGPPRGYSLVSGDFTRALDGRDRREIGRAMRARLGEPGQFRGAREASRAAMIEALRAEPFDADAFASLIEEEIARAESFRRVAQEEFVARIVAMSAEERAAFADRLAEGRRRQ